MMMRASSSVRCVCILGLAASIIAFAANVPHALDPLRAVGLAYSLWVAGLVFLAIGLAALGLIRLMTGMIVALAPLASWAFDLLNDPLGLQQRRLGRARVDKFLAPHTSLRGFHVS